MSCARRCSPRRCEFPVIPVDLGNGEDDFGGDGEDDTSAGVNETPLGLSSPLPWSCNGGSGSMLLCSLSPCTSGRRLVEFKAT